jgi:hypothetical protein
MRGTGRECALVTRLAHRVEKKIARRRHRRTKTANTPPCAYASPASQRRHSECQGSPDPRRPRNASPYWAERGRRPWRGTAPRSRASRTRRPARCPGASQERPRLCMRPSTRLRRAPHDRWQALATVSSQNAPTFRMLATPPGMLENPRIVQDATPAESSCRQLNPAVARGWLRVLRGPAKRPREVMACPARSITTIRS